MPATLSARAPAQLPATRRAVVLDCTGGPEVLRLADEPLPVPGADQVLVRVAAAGVAFAQVMMRRGTYAWAPPFPFVPGAEIAGEIAAVGADVRGWRAGDRVAAFTGTGGYADFALASAADLVRLPEGVDPARAAALPMNYVTAHQLLHREARVREGEWVLVHGAAGGVGTALLQLASLAGARVVATASPGKLGLARELGAAVAIDYTQGDVAARVLAAVGGAVDVVLDPLGGDHVLESRRVLRRGGRLVVYGFAAPGADAPAAIAALRARLAAWNAEGEGEVAASLYSLGALYRSERETVRADLERMVRLLAAGRIAPVIDERIPLREVRHAHERLERGDVQGKLVLVAEGA